MFFDKKETVVAGLIVVVAVSTCFVAIKSQSIELFILGVANFILGVVVKVQLESK